MPDRLTTRQLLVASFDRESLNFALLQIQKQLDEIRGLRGDVTIFNNTTVQGTATVTGILTLGAANFATTATLADIAATEAAGTSTLVPRGDHVHAHGSGYLPNAHHNQSHVLATGTALGPDHTMSGAAAGEVLRALSATTAAFDVLALSDVSPRAHATLTSLLVDDHTQYLLLAGRSGTTNDPIISTGADGIISGSSASGGNLSLRSTTNATKGLVQLGSATPKSAFDEANNRWGFFTTAPTVPFHITRTLSSGTLGFLNHTQDTPNAGDTADTALDLTYTLLANSATNQLVSRVYRMNVVNNLTGGGLLQNARCVDLSFDAGASTTTTELSSIFFNAPTGAGTITRVIALDVGALGLAQNIMRVPTDNTDPTGGGGAATGRIRILDASNNVRYIPYYT